MGTQMGRIAGALNAAKKQETPLQKRMNQLSRVLSLAVLAIAAVVFLAGMLQGRGAFDMFLTAVSLAVAAIPEGLAAVVTVVLTMGVQKMSKQGAIIRKLPAVETLGCTDVICSDKTGTLTQNKMTVINAYVNDTVSEADAFAESREAALLLACMTLCNDSKSSVKDGKKYIFGRPDRDRAGFFFPDVPDRPGTDDMNSIRVYPSCLSIRNAN